VKLGFRTGFATPKRIVIFGTQIAQPNAFNIHIGEPGKLLVNANVLFHMSPRLNENIVKRIEAYKNKLISFQVIRNTWIVGKGWEKEEVYGGFPFKAGEPFVLELIAALKYTISVINFSKIIV